MTRLIFILSLFSIGIWIPACESPAPEKPDIILVMVPPFVDPSLTEGENLCRFHIWRYAPKDGQDIDIDRSCKNAGIPQDAGIFLQVRLHEDGKVSLNGETNGTLDNLNPLINRLRQIFEERKINGAYEEGTWNVNKEIGLDLPPSTRYGDFFDLARAVKTSGADPILLILDGHVH